MQPSHRPWQQLSGQGYRHTRAAERREDRFERRGGAETSQPEGWGNPPHLLTAAARAKPKPRLLPGDGVGAPGFEPGTSALSGLRSNQLSYAPVGGNASYHARSRSVKEKSWGGSEPGRMATAWAGRCGRRSCRGAAGCSDNGRRCSRRWWVRRFRQPRRA